MFAKSNLVKVHDGLWEIPRSHRADMRVPARVYASDHMLEQITTDRSLEQLVNVATLPGITGYALAMPDIHEGYGFPVGGVAAFDAEDGVISPGGIGYDINCGVRLLCSDVRASEIQPRLSELGAALYREVPSGVGQGGRLVMKGAEMDAVLEGGAPRLVELGYGEAADLERIESRGKLEQADAALVYYRDTPVNRHRASMKLREALASGPRVVATAVGEAVQFKKALFLSKPDPKSFAKAVLTALKAKKSPQAGALLVKKWDWVNCVEMLEKAFLKETP